MSKYSEQGSISKGILKIVDCEKKLSILVDGLKDYIEEETWDVALNIDDDNNPIIDIFGPDFETWRKCNFQEVLDFLKEGVEEDMGDNEARNTKIAKVWVKAMKDAADYLQKAIDDNL